MKKRVLITGDSITRGVPGFGYIPLLRRRLPETKFYPRGVGGDTLIGIGNRLLLHLDKRNDYDAIVIEAGHNDIILPTFIDKSPFWQTTYNFLVKRGSVPIENPVVFGEQLGFTIRQIRRLTSSPVCLTTLSCMTEQFDHPLNLLRHQYNEQIRSVAESTSCHVAEVAALFDSRMKTFNGNDRFLGSPLETAMLDQVITKFSVGSKLLADLRKTELTIDGVHPNRQGALLYAEAIGAVLEEVT
jgi:lysophospholipase L1-like esterase